MRIYRKRSATNLDLSSSQVYGTWWFRAYFEQSVLWSWLKFRDMLSGTNIQTSIYTANFKDIILAGHFAKLLACYKSGQVNPLIWWAWFTHSYFVCFSLIQWTKIDSNRTIENNPRKGTRYLKNPSLAIKPQESNPKRESQSETEGFH